MDKLKKQLGKAAITAAVLVAIATQSLAQTPLWNSQVNTSGEESVPVENPPVPSPDLATWRVQAESQIAAISNRVMSVYIDWTAGWTTIDLGANEFDLIPKLGWSVSEDGGKTFTDEGTLYTGTPNDGPDPTLVADLVNKQFVLSTLTVLTEAQGAPSGYGGKHGLFLFSSAYSWNGSEGAANPPTWSGPLQPLYKLDNRALTIDKPWLAVDNFPGTGQGNQYVAFNLEATETELLEAQNQQIDLQPGIYLLRRPAGGSWLPSSLSAMANSSYPTDAMNDLVSVRVQTRPGIPNEDDTGHASGVQVVVAPDHKVYVFWLEGKYVQPQGDPASPYQRLMMRKYSSAGVALTAATTVVNLNSGWHNDRNALNLSGLDRSDSYPRTAVNPSSGELYVVYADKPASGTDKANIYFISSSNGGSTWSTPLKVNDDSTTRDQFQPVIAIKPNGKQMFIGWYSRQNDPNNYDVDIYGRKLVYQYPSGWTWLPSFRITPQSFHGGSATTTARLHDYDGVFADSSAFYFSWTDRSLASTRESDIYATRIPAHPTQHYVFEAAGGVPSNMETIAYAVNNSSSPQAAGYFREDVGGYYWNRAFRGDPYNLVSLMPTEYAEARDINDSLTTTGYRYDGWWQAWRLTAGGTLQFLQPLSSWWPIAEGQAINNAGTVVGVSVNNNGQDRATYWAAGQTSPYDMGTLNFNLSGSSRAFDVNSIGRTTGSADRNGIVSAFRTAWDYPRDIDPTISSQYLGTLGGMSEGHAINEEGWVAGYSQLSSGQYRAFLCPPFAQLQSTDDLGTLGGTYSIGLGLNNSLPVVGESLTASSGNRAFVRFHGGTMTDLNTLLDPVYGYGWLLRAAWDVNDHGVIVGQGEFNGTLRGFIAYPMN